MSARADLLIYDASPYYGGALTSLEALVELLDQERLHCTIVCASDHAATRLAPQLPPSVDLHTLYEQHIDAHTHGRAWLKRELRRLHQLHAIILERSPKLLIANNGPQTNAALIVAAKLHGKPLIQYLRGPIWPSPLTDSLLACASACFTASPTAPPHHAQHIPEGLSSAQRPQPRSRDAFGVFWAGADVPWKGLDWFLAAYPSFGLARPLRACAIRTPTSKPHTPHPQLELHWDLPDLNPVRRRCDLYVHTSLSPEPFGRSLLEARCAGLCPIAPDEGGCAAQIEHMQTGLLYKPGDLESLKQALLWAQEHPLAIAKMSANAQQQALAQSQAARCFAPLLKAIHQLMA